MHDDMKDTIAIVSIQNTAQLPEALKIANDVLNLTPTHHNNAKLVFLLSGIGSLSPESVELCTALPGATLDIPGIERSFIVHGSLQVLRFADHQTTGELCRIPANADLLKGTVKCLLRRPPIKGRGDFPAEWTEYIDLLDVFKKWGNFQSFGDDTADVLAIFMCLKALKSSFYTATTTVSVERFLKNGKEWHKDDFLENCGLYDDEQTLRTYGKQQANNARNALDAMFNAVDTVLALLQQANIAEQHGERSLTIAGSKKDVARVPVGVTVDDMELFLEYKTRIRKDDDWLQMTNDSFQTMVTALRENDKDVDTRLVGYFAFNESEFVVDTDDDAPLVQNDREATLITADKLSAVNQINCERVIRKDSIEQVECVPVVRHQQGLSFGVVFITFCSSMGEVIFGEKKNGIASSSLLDASNELQTIAADLSTVAELSNLVGRLSGVVDVEGATRRVATFKRTNSVRDELVVFLPQTIVNAYFFDYKSGAYSDDNGLQLPVFASTSVITVSDSARISPDVAQLLPPRLNGLRAENVTSWRGLLKGRSNSAGGSFSLSIQEQQADALVGLKVKFGVSGGIFTLLSAHEKELVI